MALIFSDTSTIDLLGTWDGNDVFISSDATLARGFSVSNFSNKIKKIID